MISHLLFADDSLLLLEASNEVVDCLKLLVTRYQNLSDQFINTKKSIIEFPRIVALDVANSISICQYNTLIPCEGSILVSLVLFENLRNRSSPTLKTTLTRRFEDGRKSFYPKGPGRSNQSYFTSNLGFMACLLSCFLNLSSTRPSHL